MFGSTARPPFSFPGVEGEGGRALVSPATSQLCGGGSSRRCDQQRFLDEAKLGQRLSHPSLATVHDVVVEGGWLCAVMALVRGPFVWYVKLAAQPEKKTLEAVKRI